MTEKALKPNNLARDPLMEGLKRLFDDIVREPVPAEFLDLLDKIDAKAADKPLAPDGKRK